MMDPGNFLSMKEKSEYFGINNYNPIDSLIKLLLIPPSQRQSTEISQLKHLTATLSFFTSQPTETSDLTHFHYCHAMQYAHYLVSEQIFDYGQPADKFFIILNGLVEILIPSDPQNPSQRIILETGSSFGELSLSKDHFRHNTATALKETHLGIISKEDYQKIHGKISEKKLAFFVDLLKENSVFKSWGKKNLEALSYSFKNLAFLRKNIVFLEGSEAAYVYIVKSGEFEMSKMTCFAGNQVKFDVKIAIITKGEMFGDDDVLEERERRYKCACHSLTGELLAISAKDFLAKVKSDDSISLITTKIEARHEIRSSHSKALEQLFTNSSLSKTNIKRKSAIKKFQRFLPAINRGHSERKRVDYLELSHNDIQHIKSRAIPERSNRMFISMNTPVDYSYKTPSPTFRNKSGLFKHIGKRRVNCFSKSILY